MAARIVHTPVRFFPAYGGVEKYVLGLSQQLTAMGHQVTVVCADEPHAEVSELSGVKVVRLPYLAKVANTNITVGLLRTLMAEDFDIIHTHIPTPWSADISAVVSLLKRKPLFVTYHNDLVGQGFSDLVARLYNRTLLHFVLWRASGIIIAQPRYADYSAHLGRYRRKLITIPVGVTEPEGGQKVDRTPGKIFFMSLLDHHHEYKGLGVLLRAMVTLLHSVPSARLVVGGGGDLVEKYRRDAASMGVAAQVEFAGPLSDADLAFHYQSSSVFVLPSLNHLEGFGIVALEALSHGTPVITTPVTGSSDFIMRHGAGVVIPADDPERLSAGIQELLEQPDEAEMMGRRGAAAVGEEYGWPGIAARIANSYGL